MSVVSEQAVEEPADALTIYNTDFNEFKECEYVDDDDYFDLYDELVQEGD